MIAVKRAFSHERLMLLVALAVFLGAVFATQLEQRENSYQGCLRGAADRHVNAQGWRTAQAARIASAATGGPSAATDTVAARKYDAIASSLEARTRPTQEGRRAFCADAFPRFPLPNP